ncbi:MAG: PAS domain S-box protein [Bacteroidales bacterium]|nr:PAS domain S-box protein [Bacteroidales bacterium]
MFPLQKNINHPVESEAQTDNRYYSIFNNAPIGIFRSTPAGKFIEVNKTLAMLLGYGSPQEALEQITDISRQIYVQSLKRQLVVSQTESSDQVQIFENVYKRKNGEHFIANLYLKVVKGENGETLFLEGMVEDITDRKNQEARLAESELKYKKLLEEAPVGIMLLKDSQPELVNKALLNMLGFNSAEEPKTEDICGVAHQEHHKTVQERLETVKNESITHPVTSHFKVNTLDEKIMHLAEYKTTFEVNNVKYTQLIVQDITGIIEAEKGKKSWPAKMSTSNANCNCSNG